MSPKSKKAPAKRSGYFSRVTLERIPGTEFTTAMDRVECYQGTNILLGTLYVDAGKGAKLAAHLEAFTP